MTETALMKSAAEGDQDRVAALLAERADVSELDGDGDSVLTYAGYSRSLPILRMLLDAGANANAEAVWRQPYRPNLSASSLPRYSILHAYARSGWTEGVAELLARGASTSSRSTARESRIIGAEGATPLMMASGRGHNACIKLLVKAGAAINDVDSDGDSVLFYAVSMGFTASARLLLSLGADPDPAPGHQPGRQSETPLIFAARSATAPGMNLSPALTATDESPQTIFNEIVGELIRAGADPTSMYRAGYMLMRGWQPIRLSRVRLELASGPGCYVAPVSFLNQLPWTSETGPHNLME